MRLNEILKERRKSFYRGMKDREQDLTDDEYNKCIKSGAIVKYEGNYKPTCKIWKSTDYRGQIRYGFNVGNTYKTFPTIDSAIRNYNEYKKKEENK